MGQKVTLELCNGLVRKQTRIIFFFSKLITFCALAGNPILHWLLGLWVNAIARAKVKTKGTLCAYLLDPSAYVCT